MILLVQRYFKSNYLTKNKITKYLKNILGKKKKKNFKET